MEEPSSIYSLPTLRNQASQTSANRRGLFWLQSALLSPALCTFPTGSLKCHSRLNLRSSSHHPNRPLPHSSYVRSRAARRQRRKKRRASRVRIWAWACGPPLRGRNRRPRRGREAARGARARLRRKGTDVHCRMEIMSVSSHWLALHTQHEREATSGGRDRKRRRELTRCVSPS